MKDEYVSVEHLMLSLLDNANREIKDLLKNIILRKIIS